jgi:hypothetical protein
MSVTLDSIVPVTVLASAIPPGVQGFGAGMFVGRSTVLPLESRVLITAQPSDATAAGFSATSEEYLATNMYYAQIPRPAGPFKIGRQFLTAQSGKLLSGGVTQVLASYTAITNGGFDITVNATLIQVTALNLSGAASMAAVAALIQTKLAAGLASTTCTFTNGRFVINSPTTGATSLVSYAVAPTGGGAPVDITALLQITVTTGARKVDGIAIESMTASLTATLALDAGWYGLAIPQQNSVQDNKDCMAFCQTNKIKFWCTTPDVTCYDPASTTDLMYYAQATSYGYTFVLYQETPYAAVSAMAREQVTNLNAIDGMGTLMFKQLPGVTASNLTPTQIAAMKAKNGNFYVTRAAPGATGLNELENGKMADGVFSDERFGLDAFSAEVQNGVFTALATPTTKVKQTDAGGQQVLQGAIPACEKFVRNGFFAPGTWLSASIANLVTQGEFMKTGYRLRMEPMATQSVSDRAIRITPPITIAAKGAGAFHGAAITFVFDR